MPAPPAVFPNALLQHAGLDASAAQAFSTTWSYQEASKGHVLLRPQDTARYLYYIAQGMTRTFYYKDDRDVTDWFSTEGMFAVSIVSFLTGAPDIRGIETLEPCMLWRISREALEDLYSSHPTIERFGRMLMSQGIVQMQRRFDDLHFATASERYRRLMESRPEILQRAPLSAVASYLGMAAETLSRVRAGGSF